MIDAMRSEAEKEAQARLKAAYKRTAECKIRLELTDVAVEAMCSLGTPRLLAHALYRHIAAGKIPGVSLTK